MIKKQYTLYLEHRPGVLARITRLLADESIGIDAISASAGTDVGLVQLVPDNPRAAQRAFAAVGIPFTVQDVVVAAVTNRPGALHELIARLAREKININYVYGTGCRCAAATETLVVISAQELDQVEALLGRRAKPARAAGPRKR